MADGAQQLRHGIDSDLPLLRRVESQPVRIIDRFTEALVERVRAMKLGDPIYGNIMMIGALAAIDQRYGGAA